MSVISASTLPYRIVKTRYTLSDVSDFTPPSRIDHHNHHHHHHHNYDSNYDYEYDDDEDADADYNYYNYYRRHGSCDNVPDDSPSVMDHRTKLRVRSIDPNKGQCFVEMNGDHAGVIYGYCVPPHAFEKESDVLDSLEWFWKMEYYTLNFESSRNIFRVGASIEQLYGKHFWLLLPEEDIVNQYHNALTEVDGTWTAHRETFPLIPNRKSFQYHFIAISNKMHKIAISRRINHPEPSEFNYTPPPTPDDFIVSVYPFSNMPLMTCHVHPRYALLEAGRKLTKRVKQEKLNELLEEYALLKKVIQIYGAWTGKRPDNAMEDASYYTLQRPKGAGDASASGENDAGDDDGDDKDVFMKDDST